MKTLEEVIKDKATLSSAFEDTEIYSHPGLHHLNIHFDTNIYFKDILFNDNKEMYDFLKPFIFYVYSLTYNIKFVRGHILLMENISFSYSNERNEFHHQFDFFFFFFFSGKDSIREFNKNLLKNDDEELVNKGHTQLNYI